MLLQVEPTRYADAGALLAAANTTAADVASDAFDAVGDCHQVAGCGDGARTWAAAYDDVATTLAARLSRLVDALGNTGLLLDVSGRNHHRADAAPYGMPSYAEPRRSYDSVWLSGLATSYGGTSGVPRGWHWLAGHLGGYVWPGTDLGRLRSIAAGWASAATRLRELRWMPLQAADSLETMRSPEIPHAVRVCTRLAAETVALADDCDALASSCRAYAGQVEAKRDAVGEAVRDFVALTVVSEATGALLAFFTAGASELFTQLEEAGTVAVYAEKITALLRPLQPELVALRPAVAGAERDDFLLAVSGAKPEIAAIEAENAAAGGAAAEAATTGSRWASKRTLAGHFARHGADVNAASESEYAEAAADLLGRARALGLPTKIDQSGSIRVFDPVSSLFGSYTKDGLARTLFRPSPDPLAYWERQIGELQ